MDHDSIKNTTGHHLLDLTESQNLRLVCLVRLFLKILPALSHLITSYCISHNWKFMREKNLTLEEGTTHILHQIHNDSFIMEDFITAYF